MSASFTSLVAEITDVLDSKLASAAPHWSVAHHRKFVDDLVACIAAKIPTLTLVQDEMDRRVLTGLAKAETRTTMAEREALVRILGAKP